MYKFNRNFFKIIDSEEKAYVLGFFYADGYNSNTQISFVQTLKDIDILNKINIALESEVPITTLDDGIHEIRKELRLSSREMCKDLSKLGGIKCKSLVLEFPNENILPKHLIRHFIRGYFDGDGCIWSGKRKKMMIKDCKHPGKFKEKTIHNVKFTFVGTIKLITVIQNILINEINLNKTKLNFTKRKESSDSWCTMEYSGRKNAKKLFNYLYKDSTIFGKRKYDKFLKIFSALEEKSSKDTSLIAGTPEMVISSEASLEERSSTIPEMGVEPSGSKCEAPNLKKKGEDIVSSAIK